MKEFRFQFPEKTKGILVCDIFVEAEDDIGACEKLRNYLSELKWTFFRPPAKLGVTADPKQIGNEMVSRLLALNDPTAIVITLHLFTEYWLNEVLRKFCPLRDLTNYRYFKKLEIAYAMGKLTEDIYHNLKALNSVRNKIAHDIDYDLRTMDLDYKGCQPGWELSAYKPSYDPQSKQHHIRNVIVGIMAVTYVPLHNHCVKELGFAGALMFDKIDVI